ncbi:MAG: hypothetical protein JW829_00545 [Pirellulales bacterium]|nr:hypothetical protein [Pirellulales bacterium]
MSETVHVHSQAAIEEFRAALLLFSSQCQDAVDGLNAEVRRFADWIEHDRPAYWKEQTRLAERGVHDAKLALERCLISGIAGERPACREERAALHQAQLRLASCRAHIERVRHWRQQLHHEQSELTGRLGQLGQLIEWNIPQAAATLARILDRLDAYIATQAAGTGIPAHFQETDESPPMDEDPDTEDSNGAISP